MSASLEVRFSRYLLLFKPQNINFHILKKSWVNKFAYNHATVSAKDKGTPSI